jgi:hypothetical protein
MRLPFRRRAGGGSGGSASARPPAPFIVGAGHSGTTLLRMMLDAHPELTIPPETGFVPEVFKRARRARKQTGRRPGAEELVELIASHRRWGDFGLDRDALLARVRAADETPTARQAVRAFYALYAAGQGKPRWGDKTPAYAAAMVPLQRYLPEARFIHLIRDGRDVALSRLRRRSDDLEAVAHAAERWRSRVLAARSRAGRVEHYMEARFEDLVLDSERVLREVCEFVELPFDPVMLRYHERAPERLAEMADALPPPQDGERGDVPAERLRNRRLRRHALAAEPPRGDRVEVWRERMTPEARAAFEGAAGDLLVELGYPLGDATADAAGAEAALR